MISQVIFLVMSFIIFNGAATIIPKKLTKSEIYISCIFALLLQLSVDVILDLKYNLYGYFKKGPDLESFIVFFGIYPAANVLILNFFPFKKSIKDKLIYAVAISILCIGYEWLSLKAGYFYYKSWKLWYSFFSYIIIVFILVWDLLIIRKLQRNDKLSKSN